MKSIKKAIVLVFYALIIIFGSIFLMSSLLTWFGYIGLWIGFVGSVIGAYLLYKLSNNIGIFSELAIIKKILDLLIKLIKFLVTKFNYATKVSKKNPQTTLLLIILLIISIPYITKSYTSIQENYHQYQAQKEEARKAKLVEEENRRINEENSKVDVENTRRELLLKKYGITKLEKINNCQNQKIRCTTQYQIPKPVIDYLFGVYLDTKTSTNIECRKYFDYITKKDKYIDVKYCDKFFCRKYRTYTELVTKSEVVLTEEQKQVISELKSLGFYSNNDKELVTGVMDKCDRLNFKESFEEFQKEVPSIGTMLRENPKDPILNSLSRSYINFTIINH